MECAGTGSQLPHREEFIPKIQPKPALFHLELIPAFPGSPISCKYSLFFIFPAALEIHSEVTPELPFPRLNIPKVSVDKFGVFSPLNHAKK